MSEKKPVSGAVVAIAFAMVPVSVMVNAWALRALWAWFMVPEFGYKPLTFLGAFGLATIVSFLTYRSSKSTATTASEALAVGLAHCIINPLFTVGFAWLVMRLAGGGQ